MAVFKQVILTILSLLIISTFCAPIPAAHRKSLNPRYYSVALGKGQWPGRGGNYETPIWYCYADQKAADELPSIVLAAVAKWAPSFIPTSTLTIDLHPLCKNHQTCLCETLPQPNDALVISSTGPGGETASTIGYDFVNQDVPNRNTLKFGGYYDGADEDQQAEWALSMAHELGHTIGFAHEHQRPDRDDFIQFHCEHMRQYAGVREQVGPSTDPAFNGETNVDNKMNMVCSNDGLADKFGFDTVKDYIKGNYIEDFNTYEYNTDSYDAMSIMNYDTFTESKDMNGFIETDGVLALVNPEADPEDDDYLQEIWQGGSDDPAKAGPSEGDFARVRYLYPRRNPTF